MPTLNTIPSTQQLSEYAKKLPEIYSQLLTAFGSFDPDRIIGDVVPTSVLYDRLGRLVPGYSNRQIQAALDQMEDKDFLMQDEHTQTIRLTEPGELLLSAVTGKIARPVVIPPLPQPDW